MKTLCQTAVSGRVPAQSEKAISYQAKPMNGARLSESRMPNDSRSSYALADWCIASLITLAAASLRIACLGSPFHSSDHAELAVRIMTEPGYAWMIHEFYGFLISIYVKLCAAFVSALGMGLTEFWWRLPIAMVGSAQPALTFLFLRWLGCRRIGALVGGAFMAVLPIHVLNSRYSWGYETLGLFWLTLSAWALIAFLRHPSARNAAWSSIALALYVISHGFFLPSVVCFGGILLAHGGANGILQFCRRGVWLGPLLVSPLLVPPLRHAFDKDTRLGMYVLDHFPLFLGNMGVPLCIVVLASIVAGLAWRPYRTREGLLFALAGAAFLAPLMLATPPGVTLVSGYLLMGTSLWVLSCALTLDLVARRLPWAVTTLVLLTSALTGWGAARVAIHPDAEWVRPLGVKVSQGATARDCGSKAAGYYIRKRVPAHCRILVLARAIEPPNALYYFGRDAQAFYDLSHAQTIEMFERFGDDADVVVCSQSQRAVVEAHGGFVLRAVVMNRFAPRLRLYAKADLPLPREVLHTDEVNPLYDRQFAPRVSLFAP